MHDYMLRSMVEHHFRHRMSEADSRRLVRDARAATYNSPAPVVPEAIFAEKTVLDVRPIQRDDTERLTRLFGRLSPQSVQLRFFAPIRRLSSAHLTRLVDVDHDQREALVALSNDEIIAVARYHGHVGSSEAEIAVTVEDTWQRRGIGSQLGSRLSALAIERGFETFLANIVAENRAALRFVRRLSPDALITFHSGEYQALIPLLRT